MLRLWAFSLLFLHCVLAGHINVEQQLTTPVSMVVVTSKPDSKLSLRPSNDLRNSDADSDNNKEEDDYYSDNEQSDSIDVDDEVQNRVFPSSSPTPTSTATPNTTAATPTTTTTTTTTTAATTSLAWRQSSGYLRRVPRHPHHLLHDNRVDGDAAAAAFKEEEGYQSDQAVGVLTAQKQQEVGSPDMVKLSRRRYEESRTPNPTQLRRMAAEHRQRIETEGNCRWPQRRLVYMNSETSKQYAPRATHLHRCDESTGCCADSMVCTVKSKETVELAFWVLGTGSFRGKAELVSLTNHTECECVNLATQRRKRSSQCQCPKHFSNFSHFTWQRGGGGVSLGNLLPSCRCDCHLNDATCQRMKNGEEGFAMSERRCILRNECSQPICNYGFYNASSGRCPRPSQQQRQLGFG